MERINFIVVGDIKSGKTSIVQRFVTNHFNPVYSPTYDIEFDSLTFKNYILQIWDVSGHYSFKKSLRYRYKECQIAICLFTSLGTTLEFVNDIKEHAPDAIIVLVSAMKDLKTNSNVAKDAANQLNCMHFDVSAKTGYGIDNLFLTCLEHFLNSKNDAKKEVEDIKFIQLEEKQTECCALI
jgi:small GTP-binding protein